MAISSIAASPPFAPFVSSSPGIRGVQEALALSVEQNLTGADNAIVGFDSAEFSQAGLLLSSVAEISDAATAAETGNTVSNSAVVENVQRFVDSVNALSFDDQLTTFTLGALLDISGGTLAPPAPVAQPAEPEAPGIDVVPVGDDGSFLLTLDSEALQSALEADVVGTTNQLAAFAVPLGNAVIQAEINQQLAGGTAAFAVTTESLLASVPAPTTLLTPPVVPDLTAENAALRQALADTALADILDTAAAAANVPVQELTAESVTSLPFATNALPATDDVVPENDVLLAPAAPPGLATPVIAPVAAGNDVAALTAAQTATLQTDATMTLAALTTTPLEQITQLASNPTVAGAVAAFQIPVDDSGRAARVSMASAFDLVNPTAVVAQTGAIGPNLSNSGEQRRDNSGDTRLNRWWTTRPGLL